MFLSGAKTLAKAGCERNWAPESGYIRLSCYLWVRRELSC